jgi:pimeloyl-ACP methyl ester carboxylesterase
MSTYVFVPGGWHGGWCWKRVADRLRAGGNDVFTPTLTGLGERAHLLNPTVDVETHVADVLAVIEWEDLHDVVLVGHSYGGMVITAIADRAPERLARVVYVDALWPQDGESVADIVGEEAARTVTAAQSDPATGPLIVGADQLAALLGVTDPDDIAWLASKLTPQPAGSATQALRLEHAGAIVDTLFVSCRGTTFEGTELSYARAREHAATDPKVRTVEIDAPHNVMVTHPDLLTDVLTR